MKITDPVCNERLDMDAALPRAEHDGWVYFFCSRECRDRFLASPDRHAAAPQPVSRRN